MNLHIATPRTGTRRHILGPMLAIAAATVILAGATAGGLAWSASSHRSATPQRAAATHVTTYSGQGRTDIMGGYAEYLQGQSQALASIGDVPANAQAEPALATNATTRTDTMGGYAEYLHDAALPVSSDTAAALSDLGNLQQTSAQPVATLQEIQSENAFLAANGLPPIQTSDSQPAAQTSGAAPVTPEDPLQAR